MVQAIEEMRRSEGFPVLVVAGWNAREQDMRVEMLAAESGRLIDQEATSPVWV